MPISNRIEREREMERERDQVEEKMQIIAIVINDQNRILLLL